MSGAESEPTEEPPFVEDDRRETKLGYDKGGFPVPIGILWAALVITYVVVMWILALPDLRQWLAH